MKNTATEQGHWIPFKHSLPLLLWQTNWQWIPFKQSLELVALRKQKTKQKSKQINNDDKILLKILQRPFQPSWKNYLQPL